MHALILAIRLALATVQPCPASEPAALILDLSGPAEIESEFPTISAKGRL